MSDHLPYRWRERLLQMLLAPVNGQNLRFLAAMARAEGGVARYNPLNVVYPLPWSSVLPGNTAGVREYDTPIEGIGATAAIFGRDKITNGYFTSLWVDLQAGTYKAEMLVERNRAVLKAHWTNPDLMLAILAEPTIAP